MKFRTISSALKHRCTKLFVASLFYFLSAHNVFAQVPPTAVADNAYTPDTAPVTIYVTNNDQQGTSPIDQTSVTVSTPISPQWGSLQVSPNGNALIYTPAEGHSGTYTCQYYIRDVNGYASTPATVTIQVTHNPPQAVNDSDWSLYNSHVDINVLQNDIQGASPIDVTSVEIGTQPTRGTVSVNPVNGTITYTPTGTAAGMDTFEYHVFDTQEWVSNSATVTINVINNPPVLQTFSSWYVGSNYVRFEGDVTDEDKANCTVHVWGQGPIDKTLTTDSQGHFSFTSHVDFQWGMVQGQVKDSANQQSQAVMLFYFCI